ncbi:MAG: DUF4062 domain-containing protein [Candidatus Symbiothrix sp.]|jgi:predicted HTH transcriptional regulator|nr:DUF4062 domain-containing protein [Candidatus Symbiothrix sp.]
MRYKIFISSVQKEFAGERRMLANYLQHDALFGKFFDVFIFEDLPAKDQTPNDAYINEVKQADIFIALWGKEFGYEFSDGTSPTQREFETASINNKFRLVFLLNVEESARHPKMDLLVNRLSDELIYRQFSSAPELLSDVYSSLIAFLVDKGELRVEPFDKSPNREASLSDISDEKTAWFIERARAERNLPLSVDTNKEKLLTHLNLLQGSTLSNAAILLFGTQPQRFFISSEIKCAHFHGTRVEKPIPFYQVYKGNLFELVDQAVNFVLSKIDLAVGTRSQSAMVPTAYEIPPEVIEEAIVNAVAHRDYDSTASVQVMLFADRLEIRNPGQLPSTLSIETLKQDHSSYPRNPLIAEAFYLTRYIERMGTGIQDMTTRCLEYGLPEPEFKMTDGFVVVIHRKKELAFEKVNESDAGGTIGGAIGGTIVSLTESQLAVFNLMQKDNTISVRGIGKKLGINRSGVQKHIENLKNAGVIERIGGTRGHWNIIEIGVAVCSKIAEKR